MRVWFSGPRIAGIRPGVSFGREDWKSAKALTAAQAVAPASIWSVLFLRAIQAMAWLFLFAIGAGALILISVFGAHY